jgi:hypothetical protein
MCMYPLWFSGSGREKGIEARQDPLTPGWVHSMHIVTAWLALPQPREHVPGLWARNQSKEIGRV